MSRALEIPGMLEVENLYVAGTSKKLITKHRRKGAERREHGGGGAGEKRATAAEATAAADRTVLRLRLGFMRI